MIKYECDHCGRIYNNMPEKCSICKKTTFRIKNFKYYLNN